MGHTLLSAAGDDFDDPDTVRRLLRDLREVRMAKLRKGVRVLDAGAGVQMNGVGAMEVAECRNFVVGVVDGLRYRSLLFLLFQFLFSPFWGRGGFFLLFFFSVLVLIIAIFLLQKDRGLKRTDEEGTRRGRERWLCGQPRR